MVQLAQIIIKIFCGIKSSQSFKKTATATGGMVVVFMIDGRLLTKHAFYGREAWREPWLTWLVEGAPQKL